MKFKRLPDDPRLTEAAARNRQTSKKRRSKSTFRCADCGRSLPRHLIRKSGKYKSGKVFHFCAACVKAYQANPDREETKCHSEI